MREREKKEKLVDNFKNNENNIVWYESYFPFY